MQIKVRYQDDVAVMVLNGKFHAAGDGPALRQKVREVIDKGTRKLVVNFSEVPYIDSTGIGFLAGSRITAQNSGVDLVLSNLTPQVRKILDVVRLTDFFNIVPDESAALRQAGVSERATEAKRSSDPASGKVPPDTARPK